MPWRNCDMKRLRRGVARVGKACPGKGAAPELASSGDRMRGELLYLTANLVLATLRLGPPATVTFTVCLPGRNPGSCARIRSVAAE